MLRSEFWSHNHQRHFKPRRRTAEHTLKPASQVRVWLGYGFSYLYPYPHLPVACTRVGFCTRVDHYPWWWIYRCLRKWDYHYFPWWDSKMGFPLVFYLLSQLPWKVSWFYFHAIVLIQIFRVLLCCVWYLGNFPCPRCLVHTSEVHELGMKRDFKWWEMKIRVDDDRRHMLVETVQEMIYEHGVWPGADNILALLGSKALTPTRVSFQCFWIIFPSLFWFPTMQNAFSERLAIRRNMALIFIPCLWSTCYTSLNWECGKRPSRTFFEFYMLKGATASRYLING